MSIITAHLSGNSGSGRTLGGCAKLKQRALSLSHLLIIDFRLSFGRGVNLSEAIPLQPRAIPNEGPAGSLQLEDGCAGPEQDIALASP